MIWHVDGPWTFGLVGILGSLLWLAVVIVVIVLVVRLVNSQSRQHQPPPTSSAEDLLRQRFASGEIDEEEYRRRLQVLRS